ncbi:MAG: PEP-CTERM sorting domain-containing protein [Lentisphaerae bacterium]|nr:PEP-CTERM sorting domain-containing protein [Lentisphaerota bacterium]
MKSIPSLSILVFALALNAAGAAVQWGVVSIIEFSWDGLNSDHALSVYPEGVMGGNIAGYVTTVKSSSQAILSGERGSTTASYGHMWRQLVYGDIVDQNSVMGDHGDYFFTFWDGHYNDPVTDLIINKGEPTYLGFFIESDAIDALFGWVALGYDGTKVYVIDSALETTGVGIYAGTYDAVPEPSVGLLLFAGATALLLRRRRVYINEV